MAPFLLLTLMTASRIAKTPYESAIRESLPFLASHLVVLLIVSLSPSLILWFPRLIGAAG